MELYHETRGDMEGFLVSRRNMLRGHGRLSLLDALPMGLDQQVAGDAAGHRLGGLHDQLLLQCPSRLGRSDDDSCRLSMDEAGRSDALRGLGNGRLLGAECWLSGFIPNAASGGFPRRRMVSARLRRSRGLPLYGCDRRQSLNNLKGREFVTKQGLTSGVPNNRVNLTVRPAGYAGRWA